MPRGQRDYGMYSPKTEGASLADMAELAARLGSIVEYDRRGDVVGLDDFEQPILRWNIWSSDPGGFAILDSDSVHSGSQAIKLHTPDVASARVQLTRGMPAQRARKLGLEIHFGNPPFNTDLEGYLIYYDNAGFHQAGFKFESSTGSIYVYTTGGAWHPVFTPVGVVRQAFMFYPIKFVIDFDADLYERLLYSSDEFDISNIPCRLLGVPTGPYTIAQFIFRNDNNTGGDIWLDDFIFTRDEP